MHFFRRAAVDNLLAKNEEDSPMDIDLIGVNAPSNSSIVLNKQEFHHTNPYILDLQTLPNVTFMVNSPYNEENDHKENGCNSDTPTNQLDKDETTEEIQRNKYESVLSPNGSWSMTKKLKNPKATLKNLKIKSLTASTKDSIHAIKTEESLVSYDVYIKLADVEVYFANDNKLAFIEILTRDFCGFLGVEINKDDGEIIIKYSTYKGMNNMVRLFNHKHNA
ncbi:hypothetical protein RclHR1_33230004 [Rhizophagus clarus]|uniref:Uncharacterized protein n=1 Tax=Rhizophagus clarus TaxID=94130 RepID=A0A2Z6R9Q5_9GLOM|nr:hypothetical protein RclHR1_33230004 [Rhizophagus clarus]